VTEPHHWMIGDKIRPRPVDMEDTSETPIISAQKNAPEKLVDENENVAYYLSLFQLGLGLIMLVSNIFPFAMQL